MIDLKNINSNLIIIIVAWFFELFAIIYWINVYQTLDFFSIVVFLCINFIAYDLATKHNHMSE